MRIVVTVLLIGMAAITSNVFAQELKWEDINYSQKLGRNKFIWSESNEVQRAAYLELYKGTIDYALQNIGKKTNELDLVKAGPRIGIFPKVTYETVSMLCREYGDLNLSAKYMHEFWFSSKGTPPNLLSAEGDLSGYVLSSYRDAGMYKELLSFYPTAYDDMLQRISIGADIKTLKSDFSEYERNWPEQAAIYKRFMQRWAKAKKLAKTTKPKPLDPAVQHHEWFYGDKQEEVLKALEYYHKFNVRFMLEKALKHKDPAIAAKAKEYLDTLVKEGAGNDKKK